MTQNLTHIGRGTFSTPSAAEYEPKGQASPYRWNLGGQVGSVESHLDELPSERQAGSGTATKLSVPSSSELAFLSVWRDLVWSVNGRIWWGFVATGHCQHWLETG